MAGKPKPKRVMGVDTISVCWSRPRQASMLRAAEQECRTLGAGVGGLKLRGSSELVPVRRGPMGSVYAKVEGISVIAFQGHDLLAIEGRLASLIAGKEAGKFRLASWDDLARVPIAATQLLFRLGLADHDDVPVDWPLPEGPIDVLTETETECRRIDIACDLYFDAGDERGIRLLERAAARTLPKHRLTVYREPTGTISINAGRPSRRSIDARFYDRAFVTGEMPGRTIRIETQHRWQAEKRPTLADLRTRFDHEAKWEAGSRLFR